MKPLVVVVALLAALCSSASPGPKRDIRRAVPWQPEAGVITAKTRRVLALETSVGPVALWAAPTRGGGECWAIEVDSGAACSANPSSDYVIRPWQSETTVGRKSLRLLTARVTPEVASVEIRFADGDADELKPTSGFVVRELREGEEPQFVVARDEHGRELRSRAMPGPRSFRRELPFPTGRYRTVIALKSGALAISPGTNGSVCRRTTYRGSQAWGCGAGPGSLAPHELDVEVWKRVLVGEVGRGISRLEVWYGRGGGGRVPVAEQYVLFELPRGRVPRLLVGFDADGSLVARRRLD